MSESFPYAPPKSTLELADDGSFSRQGKQVVFNLDAHWPHRCFKCNAETNNRKSVKTSYVNPWIYLSVLINILLAIVLVLIFSKRFTLELPVCEKHVAVRRNFIIAQWVSLFMWIGFLVAAALVKGDMETLFLIMSLFSFLTVFILSIFGRYVFVSKLKDGEVWIRGAGKGFLESLPTYHK